MGIYYSSVGTRLENYLRHEGLTVEDFAVLSPVLAARIDNLGKKSVQAVLERLEEMGMKPGTYEGEPGMSWTEPINYYKRHKDKIREKHPIVYIEKPGPEPEPTQPAEFDWDAFRREAAKDAMTGMMANADFWKQVWSHNRYNGRCDYPSEIAHFAISCADELIKQLKEEGK